MDTLREDQFTFLVISEFFLEWEIFQINLERKSKHTFYACVGLWFFVLVYSLKIAFRYRNI